MSSRRQRITPKTEQSFGADDFLGVSKASARQDHSHGTPSNPVDAHMVEADPHAQYQRESEKGAVNGYASLDAGGTVPDAQIPAGITRDAEAAAAYATAAQGALADSAVQTETDPVFLASEAADFVAGDKAKLDGIETGAEANNISDANATDLTDSGETTLHKHDHGGQDGLSDDDHTQYHNDARGDARYVAKDSVIRLKGYTVSTLPVGTQGDTCFVTDALAPTFLATVVGGGAIVTPVFYNGTNWVGY